jgi:hypothetical protein
MKKIVLILGLTLLFNFSFGQGQAVNMESFGGQGQMGSVFADMRKKKGIVSDLPTVGSVYIDEQFLPCKIYFEKDLIGDFYYRHNAYNDEIEIKDTQLGEEAESSLATIKELTLIDPDGNKELSLKTYENKKGEVRNGYLYLLNDGSTYELYTKNNVKFTEGTHAISSMVRDTPNKFSQFAEYYFIGKEDKVAHYIGTKKSDFLKSFDKETRQDLQNYIKKEKINLRDEADLIQVFNYLNAKASS